MLPSWITVTSNSCPIFLKTKAPCLKTIRLIIACDKKYYSRWWCPGNLTVKICIPKFFFFLSFFFFPIQNIFLWSKITHWSEWRFPLTINFYNYKFWNSEVTWTLDAQWPKIRRIIAVTFQWHSIAYITFKLSVGLATAISGSTSSETEPLWSFLSGLLCE